jgi:putative oxidoreductase
MLKFLDKYRDETYALLRIVTGAMFCFHGVQKILGVMSSNPSPEIGTQIWFGGLIEMFGGLLVALGAFTRQAAFLCSGTMAVAYIQFHWKGQLGPDFFPAVNRGETALLYAFVFLFLSAAGSGKWSLRRKS